MKKSDVVFFVSVHRVYRVVGCDTKRDQETRGLFGFHNYDRCPNCRMIPSGWEMWGENGHKQGIAENTAQLAHWLKTTARRQWKIQDGKIMGYRFRLNAAMYYKS